MNLIKNWNVNVKSFINLKILRSFNTFNKNKLLSIFKKFIKETDLLIELSKLVHDNVIDLSSNLIYEGNFVFLREQLSRFSLDLLLKELDIFLHRLSFNYQVKLMCYFSNIAFKNNVIFYDPITLEKFLIKFRKLNLFIGFRNVRMKNSITFLNSKKFFYEKSILKCRYIDHLLLATAGSKSFISNLCNKINNFIKTKIQFDLEYLDTFSVKENLVLFVGFNIRLCFFRSWFCTVFII